MVLVQITQFPLKSQKNIFSVIFFAKLRVLIKKYGIAENRLL
jgi:hypothetical protein